MATKKSANQPIDSERPTQDRHLPAEAARLAEISHQRLPELRENFAVRELRLFGSYVHGNETQSSDLDMLIEFTELPGLLKFIALERQLSALLGVRVDLVMKDALKPVIGRQILAEAVAI